ncbi:hypothetical protein ES288_D11G258700v1 [Gossypium darwinii]|uniref:Uncharacterized protein n=1 Tax=Gossypium darwinii TaxID=34276 RepID=A0A5D2AS14_GOSDA|nr:hypothetical protein ES288_D11G258700v1 [Gossypium darwinii]
MLSALLCSAFLLFDPLLGHFFVSMKAKFSLSKAKRKKEILEKKVDKQSSKIYNNENLFFQVGFGTWVLTFEFIYEG